MNYAFDPLTPYVVAYSTGDQPLARFRRESDAHRYRDDLMTEGVIVNTTPKPKIPEDARFITWVDEDDVQRYYAEKTGFEWVTDEAIRIGSDGLAEWIGDAEVTVLVPKDVE